MSDSNPRPAVKQGRSIDSADVERDREKTHRQRTEEFFALIDRRSAEADLQERDTFTGGLVDGPGTPGYVPKWGDA